VLIREEFLVGDVQRVGELGDAAPKCSAPAFDPAQVAVVDLADIRGASAAVFATSVDRPRKSPRQQWAAHSG